MGARLFIISLIKTEVSRLDYKADSQHTLELIIFQQVFSESVIILQEEILILVIVEFITQLYLGIETRPGLTFGQDHTTIETAVIGPVISSHLKDTVILQQVFVVFAVYDRYPSLELRPPVSGERYGNGKSHFIPATGSGAVFSVRLVFKHQVSFSYIFIMGDNQVSQADTGIKIKVFHRQRFLKDIPKGFLGILDKQIRIERQLTFCQPLGDAQLEFQLAAVGLWPIVVPPTK